MVRPLGGWSTLVLGLAGLLGSCTSAPPAPEPGVGSRLVASATQFRPDEGTRNLHAGITNRGPATVTVTSATVEWPGFSWPTVAIPARPVPAGQTAAFVIRYGAPHCATDPGPPYLRATVDGHALRLPLQVSDRGLLERLRAQACADRRLARAATLSLRWGRRTVVRRGTEYLPATVTLRRRSGSSGVSVVDLGGSVLFHLVAARPGALPARLGPSRPGLVVPVLFGSAGRCDGHSRGQSSQTFLFSVYTRLDGGRTHRSVFVPGKVVQRRLLGLLDRACRGVAPAA